MTKCIRSFSFSTMNLKIKYEVYVLRQSKLLIPPSFLPSAPEGTDESHVLQREIGHLVAGLSAVRTVRANVSAEDTVPVEVRTWGFAALRGLPLFDRSCVFKSERIVPWVSVNVCGLAKTLLII